MSYIDTHCHLGSVQFDEDRDQMIERMLEADVSKAIIICCSRHDLDIGKKLKEKHPSFKLACSIHPQDLEDHDPKRLIEIRERIIESGADMVGEIGLDYYWDKEGHDLQKHWFMRQMELSHEANLPMIVHSREAAKDTLDMVIAAKPLNLSGIIHCYSYSVEQAREYLNMGYYIGIGGVLTFKNAKKLKEVAEYAPLSQIVLETDCPYLAPTPFRGKRNDSSMIAYVAEELAAIKNMPVEEVLRITNENGRKLYHI